MAILVGRDSRILIQGITGGTGRSYAERMIKHGTPLVGGVAPGRGGQMVAGVPVFDTVAQAVSATGADCVLSAIRASLALEAMLEVLEAGIRVAVLYTEGVPVHDAIRLRAYARARGAVLLGPNSAGVISPGRANMADIADTSVKPGRVGIVSKSGTLTYEVIDGLAARGLGVSSVVCLGGDPVVGTDYVDVLTRFEADSETDAVVLIGEPGGTMEYAAAELASRMTTPVVAYITGQYAPTEKRMGHAGAIAGDRLVTAPAKLQAFRDAGCMVCDLVTDVGAAVEQRLTRT